MNVATPHSLPDGDNSSAGMSVSAAAATKACSVSVSVSSGSGCGGPLGSICWRLRNSGVAGFAGVSPDATAVPARPAPTRNLRRGMVSSLITSSPARATARGGISFVRIRIDPTGARRNGRPDSGLLHCKLGPLACLPSCQGRAAVRCSIAASHRGSHGKRQSRTSQHPSRAENRYREIPPRNLAAADATSFWFAGAAVFAFLAAGVIVYRVAESDLRQPRASRPMSVASASSSSRAAADLRARRGSRSLSLSRTPRRCRETPRP